MRVLGIQLNIQTVNIIKHRYRQGHVFYSCPNIGFDHPSYDVWVKPRDTWSHDLCAGSVTSHVLLDRRVVYVGGR